MGRPLRSNELALRKQKKAKKRAIEEARRNAKNGKRRTNGKSERRSQ